MDYELAEIQYVALDYQGEICILTELLNPVKYGQKQGVDLTVLESTGFYRVEEESRSYETDMINSFTIIGEF